MKPRIILEERFVEQMEEGMRTHGLIAHDALQVHARRVASPLPAQEALVYAEHMARLQLVLNQLKAKP
ncbi:MAG: beta-lactamase [Variovorax sp.]|nr:beta-lactamase [Variovorax sp.]